jgi:hypothetical protein
MSSRQVYVERNIAIVVVIVCSFGVFAILGVIL